MIKGLVLAVMASVLWSLNPALISRFECPSRPLTFAGLRTLVAFMLLTPFTNFKRLELDVFALMVLFASAVADLGLGVAAYTKAIGFLGGGLATVIAYTDIFVAQAIAFLIFNEELRPSLVVGAAVAFAGWL